MKNHYADINNIRFRGDDITLLGNKLTLAIYEAEGTAGFFSTSLKNRIQKVKEKTIKWSNTGNR